MGTGRELEAGDVARPSARYSSGSPPSGHSPRAFEALAFEKVASPAAWLPGIGSQGTELSTRGSVTGRGTLMQTESEFFG